MKNIWKKKEIKKGLKNKQTKPFILQETRTMMNALLYMCVHSSFLEATFTAKQAHSGHKKTPYPGL